MEAVLSKKKGIRLYNLFPRLLGNVNRWREHLPRISKMGFNAIFINPFHYPGFSGSLYSPKDYYKFNPLFFESNSHIPPKKQLHEFISACHEYNLAFIMDLVVNHTAIDSNLVEEHPNWFKHDEHGAILHPGAMHDGQWYEWGDLAQVDNESSPDRENLWEFWWTMMETYLKLGIDGFRCDMAYHLPDDLWRFLMSKARGNRQNCLFLAESLGCSFDQVVNLANLGFDYIFNSLKYWDFNQPWGMEQYHRTCNLADTIAFPESHDTDRLMNEMQDDLMAVKRQIILSALFSKGYMIPIGLEYGFKRALNVVKTDPTWWENTDVNLTDYITCINTIKDRYPVLNSEPGLEVVDQENWCNVFCFKRSIHGHNSVFVAVNKDRKNYQRLLLHDLGSILGAGPYCDVSPEFKVSEVRSHFEYWLRPSEVKVLAKA